MKFPTRWNDQEIIRVATRAFHDWDRAINRYERISRVLTYGTFSSPMQGKKRWPRRLRMNIWPPSSPNAQKKAFPVPHTPRPGRRSIHCVWLSWWQRNVVYIGPRAGWAGGSNCLKKMRHRVTYQWDCHRLLPWDCEPWFQCWEDAAWNHSTRNESPICLQISQCWTISVMVLVTRVQF